MNIIKFNRNYKKLHNQKRAELVYKCFVSGDEFKKEFIEYDTDNKYKIDKKGLYIYLLFVGNKGIPFTTLRTKNIDNEIKYANAIGTEFKIIIEGE